MPGATNSHLLCGEMDTQFCSLQLCTFFFFFFNLLLVQDLEALTQDEPDTSPAPALGVVLHLLDVNLWMCS